MSPFDAVPAEAFMPSQGPRGTMARLDLDATAKELEKLLAEVEKLGKRIEELQHQVGRAADEQAHAAVDRYIAEPQQADAHRIVSRGFRVADEVGTWMGAQGPAALARKLLPEVRAGLTEVQAYFASARTQAEVQAAKPSNGDSLPRSRTPPTPGRPTP